MKTCFTLIFLFFTYINSFSQVKSLRSNLYIVPPQGGEAVLMDGTLTNFDDQYSNTVDNKDARKMSNFSENWGMLRENYVLVVERREDIHTNDTIFFKMWNMRVITYRLEFVPKYFDGSGVNAILIDKFLGRETPLSLLENNYVDFAVTNDKNSSGTDRFMIVLKKNLPLNFLMSEANLENNNIEIRWQVANQNDIKEYQVEKSSDGIQFIPTNLSAKVTDQLSGIYSLNDMHPFFGNNYYRVNAVDKNGHSLYSKTMKVEATGVRASISMFPNPASSANIKLRFYGQKAGNYKITVSNGTGTVMHIQSENLTNAGTDIRLSTQRPLPLGIYHIEIVGPEGYRKLLNLLIQY